MVVLETERLYLRQWVPDDWLRFRPLATDPRVTHYLGTGYPWRDKQIRDFIDRQAQRFHTRGWALWGVIHRADSALIGFCGFGDCFPPDNEIGWRLLPEYWGQGLATEAAKEVLRYGFEVLGFDRVVSVAHRDNRRSIRVMEKLGLHYERSFVHRGVEVVGYAGSASPVRSVQHTPAGQPTRPPTLVVLPGLFAVCRLAATAPVPAWAVGDGFLALTRTAEELSVVCPQERVPADVRNEPGWRCVRVAGTLDFTLTGILASLTIPLARLGVGVFAISTFDTDYLLVKATDLSAACAAWRRAGCAIQGAPEPG
jgi:RimJ/RimL family protein N-acetyltransferase